MRKHSRYVIALTLLTVVGLLAGPVAAQTGDANSAASKIDLTKLKISDLSSGDKLAQIGAEIVNVLARYGLQVLGALAIFLVGRWLSKVVSGLIARGLTKAKVDPTLVPFVENLTYVVLLVLVIVAALQSMSVPMTSAVTVIGAAGLAIGLAWQGSLANFAAGVLLLLFKPFKVGDFIEAAGTKGTVKAVHIFNTILTSPDNVKIIVPNGQITGGCITNYTANDTRRVDLIASVSYDDDLQKARRVIESVLAAEKRILSEPAPQVAVSEMADSSINFVVRPWVKTSDYWAVRFDLTAKLKMAFDENGITVPFTSYQLYVNNGNGDASLKAPVK